MLMRFSTTIDLERRLGVLVGVEAAQHEHVDREGAEPEGETRQGSLSRIGIGCAELAALEERSDDRLAQHEDPDPCRNGEQRRHPEPQRGLVDESGAIASSDRSRHLGLERGRDRHRQEPVGKHEERERIDVGAGVARSGFGEIAHHQQRDLVGHDEPDRPERERHQLADCRVSEVEVGAKSEAGREHRRDEHGGHRGDADGGTQPERPAEAVIGEHVLQLPIGRPGVRERQQEGDDDDVRQDRRPGRSEESAPAVEECVGETDEPVEEDLNQEDPGERRADRPVQVGVHAVGDVDRIEPEDQWGSDDRHHGQCSHRHHRDGQHDVRGLVVVGLDERGEQRHEGCRQQTTEQQFVHDVRCLVGDQVGVGQCRLAQDVPEDDQPEQPGDPRQCRAAGNDDVAPQQPTHSSER